MGGQQFLRGEDLLDLRGLDRFIDLDSARGLIEVEAGIQWPALVEACHAVQGGIDRARWGIAQKQTGADDLTLGGALSANVHGRGLRMAPIISNVESFDLLGPNGVVRTCSRTENADRFALAVGGYGLFGVITRVSLRLVRRQKLLRIVRLLDADELMNHLEARMGAGDLFGDFQFSVDETSPDYLRHGVCATYEPVDDATPVVRVRSITSGEWLHLMELAHTDRGRAFREYTDFYRATAGQIYWSDVHQLGPYVPNYAQVIRERSGVEDWTSLAITELYVPRKRLASFLEASARVLREREAIVTYGTVRLIQRDTESFLPWAQDDFACVILNLLVRHTPAGLVFSAEVFRDLIDLALAHSGTYYLTYHRHATRAQLLRGHPRIMEFIQRKRELDPESVFDSDWFRHTAEVVAG